MNEWLLVGQEREDKLLPPIVIKAWGWLRGLATGDPAGFGGVVVAVIGVSQGCFQAVV